MERGSLRRGLGLSLWDGVFFSLMVGLGETYLPAFALALGHGELLAGLVATLPMLAGSVLQLATPRAVHHLGSRRAWVVVCAVVQALVFVPLCVSALVGRLPPLALFAAAAGYWAAGLGSGPAWTAWLPALVPRRIRSRYFASRTRAAQVAVLAGLLGGGLLLQVLDAHGAGLRAFAVLFGLAAVFRAVSAWLVALQPEPQRPSPDERPLALPRAFARMAGRSHRGLFGYLLAMQVAVQVAAPYFTPYMLGQLELDYGRYVVLVAAAYLARAVFLPLWGHLAHRTGAQRLLWIGGLGIGVSALPWVLTESFGLLLAAQVYAGAAWAAYELATFLTLFDRLDVEERTSLLALYNFANAAALAFGSLLGGTLLQHLGSGPQPYLVLFAVTTAMRLTILAVLALRPRVRVPAAPLPAEPLGMRTIAVRPSLGAIERPILAPEVAGDADPGTDAP